MAKSQYFIATGKVGGTANKQTDKTFYVDSYKGLDSNTGAYNNPYKTIQKVLDECASAGNGGAIQEVDIIATGYFEEGDFFNKRFRISFIAEGNVTIKATTHNEFILNTASTTGYTSFNFDFHSGKKKRNFGRITFKDFPQTISFGTIAYGVDVNEKHGCYNVTFKNCFKIINGGTGQVGLVEGCIFDFPVGASNMIMGSFYQPLCFVQKNIFTGASVLVTLTSSSFTPTFRDNFVNTNVRLSLTAATYNNHIYGEGITGKVNGYTSRDLLHAAVPSFDVNGKSSAVAPLFNTVLNSYDYTYQLGAPNAIGGHDGKQIGAFGEARNAVVASDVVEWTATTGTVDQTVAGSAELTSTPIAILESITGIQVVANVAEPKRLLRLTLPDSLIDYTAGHTINTSPSSGQQTPAIETVEIQFSTDDVTYSDWIKVPIEGQPLVDESSPTIKGNGDDDFDPNTQKFIELTHIKYRITLRDNEVSLP